MRHSLLFSLLLAAPALAAPDAGSPPSSFAGSEKLFEVNRLKLDFTPGAQASAETLARAAELQITLDGAVAKLREGLVAKECARPQQQGAPPLILLAHAAQARAVLGASRKEAVDGIARDLLAFGRRIARCGGSIRSFAEGVEIEKCGRELAIWGGSVGLWDAEAHKSLAAALTEGALNAADLERAVANELKSAEPPLPQQGRKPAAYDRAASVKLLRTEGDRIRAELRKPHPDFAVLKERFEGLASKDDRAYFAAFLKLSEGRSSNEPAPAPLPRPPGKNPIGRCLVSMSLGVTATSVGKLWEELRESSAQAKAFSATPAPGAR